MVPETIEKQTKFSNYVSKTTHAKIIHNQVGNLFFKQRILIKRALKKVINSPEIDSCLVIKIITLWTQKPFKIKRWKSKQLQMGMFSHSFFPNTYISKHYHSIQRQLNYTRCSFYNSSHNFRLLDSNTFR